MGTYSPAPVVTDAVAKQAMDEIMWRTGEWPKGGRVVTPLPHIHSHASLPPKARAMVAEGAPFKGTLFAGLMIKDGRVRKAGIDHVSN